MNPLSAGQPKKTKVQHPFMQHAKVWQHVSGMEPVAVDSKIAELTKVLPIMGALAAKPNVSRKDVIKAAADASGAGYIEPSQAVQFISQMPEKSDELQPWLKNLYATNLTALVHMKANVLAQQQPQAQPQVQQQPQQAPQQVAPAPQGLPQ